MSASNEILLEQIKLVQTQIKTARSEGQPTIDLELKLLELNKQFNASQQALNESAVLKG